MEKQQQQEVYGEAAPKRKRQQELYGEATAKRRSARLNPPLVNAREYKHRETLNSVALFYEGSFPPESELLPPPIIRRRRRGRISLDKDLPTILSGLNSDDMSLQLSATTTMMELLSADYYPQLGEATLLEVVPPLVTLLDYGDHDIQFQAARVLKNIVFGTSESTKVVTDCGAIPVFVKLLSSSSRIVAEQAAWALGNIAGDSCTYRDIVIDHDALPPLLKLFRRDQALPLRRIVTWALNNFCSRLPDPPFHKLVDAVIILSKVRDRDDDQVLKEAYWALSHLARGNYGVPPYGFPKFAVLTAINLLYHHSCLVVCPALRMLMMVVARSQGLHRLALQSHALQRVDTLVKKFEEVIPGSSLHNDACRLAKILRRPVSMPPPMSLEKFLQVKSVTA